MRRFRTRALREPPPGEDPPKQEEEDSRLDRLDIEDSLEDLIQEVDDLSVLETFAYWRGEISSGALESSKSRGLRLDRILSAELEFSLSKETEANYLVQATDQRVREGTFDVDSYGLGSYNGKGLSIKGVRSTAGSVSNVDFSTGTHVLSVILRRQRK